MSRFLIEKVVMLDFLPLTPEDLPRIRPYFADVTGRICDRTPGGTLLWRSYYHTAFFEDGKTLIFRIEHPVAGICYTVPQGDVAHGLSLLRGTAALRFFPVTEEDKPALVAAFGDAVSFDGDRDAADYLYEADKLIALSGNAYAGQRNQIKKFTRENPDWALEAVNEENVGEAVRFCADFFRAVHKDSDTFLAEEEEIPEAFCRFREFGMTGAILRGDCGIAAVALGEVCGDTLFVHIEKADRAFRGAYQTVVNAFTAQFAGKVKYVNREEDDGDAGLRESKLSYHPTALLVKSFAAVR